MQQRMNLRVYQRECLSAILDRYRAGARRQVVCLPTGTGKTVIFARFPSFFRMKRRMLALAHRAELLNQARDVHVKSYEARHAQEGEGSELWYLWRLAFAIIAS